MLKYFIIIASTLLLFTGCGGGGSEGDSGKVPNDHGSSDSGTPPQGAYSLWDYLTPSTSKSRSFTYNAPSGTQTYSTHFTVSGDMVTEVDDNAPQEKTVYQKRSDRITVSFQKNGQANGSYDMKRYAKIDDIVTIKDSNCRLVAHHDLISLGGKRYEDVIEIDCGNHPGYYQKYAGEIGQSQKGVDGGAEVEIYALN